jgi:hypothetical protein
VLFGGGLTLKLGLCLAQLARVSTGFAVASSSISVSIFFILHY